MGELEIIGVPQSSYVRAVRIACIEKGVSYMLREEPPHAAVVEAIHPLGKIPVMRHGGFELCESRAIAVYVDRAFPGPALFGTDAKSSALAEQWLSICHGSLLPVINAYLFFYYSPRRPSGEPDRAAIDRKWPETQRYLRLLDDTVSKNGNLAGAYFSFADMSLLPFLIYAKQCPECAELLSETTELGRYLLRHSQRTSMRMTVPPPISGAAVGTRASGI